MSREGGRSHGGEALNDTMGTDNGNRAKGGGALKIEGAQWSLKSDGPSWSRGREEARRRSQGNGPR